jgi:demethylmenaquinone methyltransferase / 2-methoxy-6-polyprenyl-1,4-benzoquinol methylase
MAGFYTEKERLREQAFEAIWNNDIDAVFSDVAKYYDRANVYATLGLIDGLRRRFISTMNIEPHHRVLDVCAGTNVVGIDLLKRQPTLDVFAVDRSKAMQEVGRRIAESQGLRINGLICDVHHLPFPDNHFDVVTLQWATRHLRAARVFAEIHRVLKPGGHFYHCDMLRPANPCIEKAYYVYLNACTWMVSSLFRSASVARQCRGYFVDAIRLFYSTEELSSVLKQLGYADVAGISVLWGTVGFHKARKAA